MIEKKNDNFINSLICVALLVNIVIFGTFSVIFSYRGVPPPYYGIVLKVARTQNPVTIDPVDAWDSVSNDVLDQVVETLIAYDLSDPDLPLVGRLAESWDFQIGERGKYNNLTFHLREEVYFHDGELFTGEDVIHTIERINFFGNWTGSLDPTLHNIAFPHSLYKFSDGIPIFNDTLSRALWDVTKTTNPNNVTIIMNRAYAPVEGLLAYTASSIVSHVSTPKYDMLDLSEDLVVGTGPFKLERYIPNSEVRFARWERYWRTGAYWDTIVYIFYRDAVTANNAMLALDIDYLGQGIASLKPDFGFDPDITVTGDGVNDYINSSLYWYIAFNRPYINKTWRKAISYAFNYTYLVEEIEENTVMRANSLVPPGFPAHNKSVNGANFDIPKARQFMQKMGYGEGWEIGTMVGNRFTPGADEALWLSASFVPEVGNFSGESWNFRHRQGSHFMELLIQRFTEDMDLIGIKLTPQVLTWDEFIEMGELHPEQLHIYFVGWGPDYFETFNMIDPLANPASSDNYARINDPRVNDLLAAAISENNTAQRYNIYMRLQSIIIDREFYHMPLFYDKIYFVHATTLKGFPYNCMRSLYWYPTYRE
ncbi:MAG: ABC transporter substrate-binding protein [Candidatus Thorarchaeota archaeon]